MKKLCYVEFVGLPGAGKSTILPLVQSNLSKKSYKVLCNWDLNNVDKFECLQIVRAIYVIILYVIIYTKDIRFALLSCLFGLLVKPLNLTSIIRSIRLPRKLEYLYSIIRRAEFNNLDFILFDQGIIQDVWSVLMTGNVWSKKIVLVMLKFINKKLHQSVYVYIDINPDISTQRISNRNTLYKRVDSFSAQTRKTLLREKYKDFETIISIMEKLNLRTLIINGENDLLDNANAITSYLENCISHNKWE